MERQPGQSLRDTRSLFLASMGSATSVPADSAPVEESKDPIRHSSRRLQECAYFSRREHLRVDFESFAGPAEAATPFRSMTDQHSFGLPLSPSICGNIGATCQFVRRDPFFTICINEPTKDANLCENGCLAPPLRVRVVCLLPAAILDGKVGSM